MFCGRTTSGTYVYDIPGFMPALHAPTCTESGYGLFSCSVCGSMSDPQTVAALGHSYRVTTTPATCEEEGSELHRCSRCGSSYTVSLAALGHDYVLTETEPTCTEAGVRHEECSRCGDVQEEEIAALGHDMMVETTEATCTEAGQRLETCQRCGLQEETTIPALGHAWPESWTVVTEPTSFAKGQEMRECVRGDAVEYRDIPRLPLTGTVGGIAVIVGGVVLLVAGGFGLKKILGKTALVTGAAAAGAAGAAAGQAASASVHGFELVKLTEKKILCRFPDTDANEAFLAVIKSRPNLSLTLCNDADGASLRELMEEVDPDGVILACEAFGLAETLAEVEELRGDEDGPAFALMVDGAASFRSKLDTAKEDGQIYAWAEESANRYVKMARLVVPLYKDLLKDADSVDAIGTVAGLFGIPAVPELLELVATGERAAEIAATAKDALAGVDMDASDGISVVGSLAEILGIDAVGAIAELTEDLGDTKESFTGEEEGKVHKTYKAGEVAKDVGDVIGSLLG